MQITVFYAREEATADVLQCSKQRYPQSLFLNAWQRHFSLGAYPRHLNKSYVCLKCEPCFTHASNLTAHRCNFENMSHRPFSSGAIEMPLNVFLKLEREAGVTGTWEFRFYPFRMMCHIESLLSKELLPDNGATTNYLSLHELLIVLVCSNAPGYKAPWCFVTEGNAVGCIGRLVDFANRVTEEAEEIVRRNFQ